MFRFIIPATSGALLLFSLWAIVILARTPATLETTLDTMSALF